MTDYTTVQRLRAAMGSEVSGTTDDVLARLITAVSRLIDRACNRPDGFVAADAPSAREYAGTGEAVLSIDECLSVSLVEAKDDPAEAAYTAWTADDWRAFSGDALAPDFTRTPYTALMTLPGGDHPVFPSGMRAGRSGSRTLSAPTVRVTARWGYGEIAPPEIETTCIIQAARWYKRGLTAFQDRAGGGELGALTYRRGLDPEAWAILEGGRYVRPRG
ncbi:MAG: hypothetical protein L6Q98_24155 [Anaerolineae bacterium]|nr:hypothetical protein [Anaerolineae bacterium]NUQ07012.1 hypothetical protein [Anaerolineae bacterium]